jgi:hypothetical protein
MSYLTKYVIQTLDTPCGWSIKVRSGLFNRSLLSCVSLAPFSQYTLEPQTNRITDIYIVLFW